MKRIVPKGILQKYHQLGTAENHGCLFVAAAMSEDRAAQKAPTASHIDGRPWVEATLTDEHTRGPGFLASNRRAMRRSRSFWPRPWTPALDQSTENRPTRVPRPISPGGFVPAFWGDGPRGRIDGVCVLPAKILTGEDGQGVLFGPRGNLIFCRRSRRRSSTQAGAARCVDLAHDPSCRPCRYPVPAHSFQIDAHSHGTPHQDAPLCCMRNRFRESDRFLSITYSP